MTYSNWTNRLFRSKKSASNPIEVGWVLDTEQAGFIWSSPQKFERETPTTEHAKSVRYCPAVLDHEARLFEVTAPIDLHLRLQFQGQNQEPVLINAAGDASTIRPRHLGQMVSLVARKEWRHPDRPILQMATPYLFIADEPVYMTQLPAFCHYPNPPLPGLVFGGRLPIHIWPRHMIWAFEWYDTQTELIVKRGQPWFYVRFETEDPSRHVRLIEADMTPALREYLKGAMAVTNYVSRTFSLFSTARERRPQNLLTPKTR